MSRLDQEYSDRFHRWEERGRGWQVFPEPVFPEPPFVPFHGHFLPPTPPIDDGAKPTFLSSLVRKLSRGLSTEPPPVPVVAEPEEEPEPTPLVREALVELQASLPDKLDIPREAFEQFLLNLSLCREPIAFELLGTHKKVAAQFVSGAGDARDPIFLTEKRLQLLPDDAFQVHNRNPVGTVPAEVPRAVSCHVHPVATGTMRDPAEEMHRWLARLLPGFELFLQNLVHLVPQGLGNDWLARNFAPFALRLGFGAPVPRLTLGVEEVEAFGTRLVEDAQNGGDRVPQDEDQEEEPGHEHEGAKKPAGDLEDHARDDEGAEKHGAQFPKLDRGGNLGEPATEEVAGAKGGRANVEDQPFPRHAQVLALLRQQATLGEIDVMNLQAGDLKVLQLLLDGCVELLRGRGEAGDQGVPVVNYVGFLP